MGTLILTDKISKALEDKDFKIKPFNKGLIVTKQFLFSTDLEKISQIIKASRICTAYHVEGNHEGGITLKIFTR